MKTGHFTIWMMAVVVGILSGSVNIAEAEDCYWAGTTADWFSPNWMYEIPEYADSAYIDNGGTVEITNGTIEAHEIYVGYSNANSGSINHTGGIFNDALVYNIYLGSSNGSTGTYYLSGTGQASAYKDEVIGGGGDGIFYQSGGTNVAGVGGSALNGVVLGKSSGSTGIYNLSAGQLTGNAFIGNQGTGTFNQTGGAYSAHYHITVGVENGSTGTYYLSGTGQLSCDNDEVIGKNGSGVFNQSGGTNTVGKNLVLGSEVGANGRYTISGGALSAQEIQVGYWGSGRFDVDDASASITVSDNLLFGVDSTFTAVDDSVIHMDGASLVNWNTDETDLAGLNNLCLVFEGGIAAGIGTFEVAGEDLGAVMAGFTENFALDALMIGGDDIGQVQLVDWRDNVPDFEALYIRDLVLDVGSYLDLNGLNLYYLNYTNLGGTIDLNGGQMTQVPEPATLLLLSLGAVMVRRKQ